jgi:hypothetical protein
MKILLYTFAQILLALADQPIKCNKSEVKVGSTWTFHATPSVETTNLYQTKEICGHQMPNKVQLIDDQY